MENFHDPAAHERALEQRARHVEALFEGIDDEVFVHDLEGRILDVNPAACRRLGYTRAELLRMSTRDIDDPEFASGFQQRLQEQLARGRLSCEGCHVAKDGRRIPVDINTSFIEIDGKPAVLAVMRDITERKTAERRLSAQYAVTRSLAESASLEAAAPAILRTLCACLGWDVGVFWCSDLQDNLLHCVAIWPVAALAAAHGAEATRQLTLSAGQEMPGRVWALGKPAWLDGNEPAALSSRERSALQAGLRGIFAFPIHGGSAALGVLEFFGKSSARPDDNLLSMLGSLGIQIGQFIERRRAEEAKQQMHQMLLQSEKLASIGLLSAGLAHEINNPLAYVANNLVVLERDLKGYQDLVAIYQDAHARLVESDPESARRARDLAEQIDLPYVQENFPRLLARTREGVERMTKIVRGLRGLARTERPVLEDVHLPDLVESSLEIIRGRLDKSRIRVEVHYDSAPRLRCVSSQIGQVLLNLLINAEQAISIMNENNAGCIEVSIRRAGREMLLEVVDNGCGIDPKDLHRIFDPFYTTKPVGEGTGLGLTISHGIVTGHGGRIEVESRPGAGSRFRVYLPLEPKI